MKTIIYKMRSSFYECTDIKNDSGEDIRIIFDEPISGSVIIGKSAYPLLRGICKMSIRDLAEGECLPTLLTNRKKYTLEGFYVKDGILLHKEPDGEYIRELFENYVALQKRLSEIEKALADIENRITQKINF